MKKGLPTIQLLLLGSGLFSALYCAPLAVADELLGRLFFTPERRQQLDRQRELNVHERQPYFPEPTLTIDGVVVRSSGRRTAWVNGIAQNERENWSGLNISPRRADPGKVRVEASDSPTVRARVGETINRSSGDAFDLLQGGQIVVKHPSSQRGSHDRSW